METLIDFVWSTWVGWLMVSALVFAGLVKWIIREARIIINRDQSLLQDGEYKVFLGLAIVVAALLAFFWHVGIPIIIAFFFLRRITNVVAAIIGGEHDNKPHFQGPEDDPHAEFRLGGDM